jgi:hypothetical protein
MRDRRWYPWQARSGQTGGSSPYCFLIPARLKRSRAGAQTNCADGDVETLTTPCEPSKALYDGAIPLIDSYKHVSVR